MKNIPNIPLPASTHANPADHDLKSLGNVEKHLRAELEIQLDGKLRVETLSPRYHKSSYHNQPSGHSGYERRINRMMDFKECYPNAKLALRGKLSDLTLTMNKRTYGAFLRHEGRIITILYMHFESRNCATCALVPDR